MTTIELLINPIVVDCIPSDCLICEANAMERETQPFWDALLAREVETLDRLIVGGAS